MMFRFKKVPTFVIALSLVVSAIGAAPYILHAQDASDTAARRAELTRQLDELNAQIAANQAVVDKLAGQGKSLSTEVQTLNATIKKAQLQLQATQVGIRQLDGNIAIHSKTISALTGKLEAEKESLAQILRNTDQFDDYSLVELALSSENFSTFFADMDTYASLKHSLGISFDVVTDTRERTSAEKNALEAKRDAHSKLAAIQDLEKKKVQEEQNKKNQLLTVTKGQESAYRAVVAAQQKTAAQIRAELFALAGGTSAISFGTAYEHAKTASRITGVRPAMILAILSQESDLGKNVGQCLITNLTTGDGKGKNTGTPFSGTMKAPRDTVPFEAILKALGRDWAATPVSCPQPGGYGGAMGPTQFIPSTWIGFEARIKSALGVSATDPWNALHAITATGLYLASVGASGGSYQAEHTAAARYYAGGNWAVAGQGYANSVMDKAAKFQKDIDTLNGG
ncbi:MAG: lytic murein transglycosylase [Candidatus Pacebacteria bacterium]|nr:lytic murein transglycosylase [Candidatus Paceibacterota bacterium]